MHERGHSDSGSAQGLPIALFCFKRPSLTQLVFEAISEYRPSVLHVFADAPRDSVPGERDLTNSVRQIFRDSDTPFPIVTHFAETNLGIQDSFHAGLRAMSSKHEKFIVLEDDCLPDQDFFRFVTDALEFYDQVADVGMVQGLNLNPASRLVRKRAYLTSRLKIWGWATWAECVRDFDPTHKPWLEEDANAVLKRAGWNFFERRSFLSSLARLDSVGTWDYQWAYHLLRQNRYAISPKGNFIVNLGFGEGSIHTVIPWPSARRTLLADSVNLNFGRTHGRVDWVDGIEVYLRFATDLAFAIRHPVRVLRRAQARKLESSG